jgi:hypothetical protein
MSLRRPSFTISLIALTFVGLLGAAPASAAPVWNVEIHHGATNFQPGEPAEYWVQVTNVGDEPNSGPATLTVELPAGLSRTEVLSPYWSCPGAAGDSTIVCTAESGSFLGVFPRHSTTTPVQVMVNVDPAVVGQTLTATATLEGGGASGVSTDSEATPIGGPAAGFGIVPGSFKADFFEADGETPVREAGSHPELATFAFDFNTILAPLPSAANSKRPDGNVRELEVELPPGFVGNPSAVGECTAAQLIAEACPRSSQVGRIDLALEPATKIKPNNLFGLNSVGVYNMSHPRGSVTDLAFDIAENIIHIRASLDPANHYAIRTAVPSINQYLPVFWQKLTLWGVPAAPSHDSERCRNFIETEESAGVGKSCPSGVAPKPFLTVPTQCGINHSMHLRRYSSWQAPGVFGPEIDYVTPGQTTDCDRPRFEPELEVNPTGQEANSPAGLEVHLKVPQNESANGLATPPVKSVKVTLPEGMTVSPSFADGLDGCTEAQIGLETERPVACPDNSRIGAVALDSPLLPKQLEGSLYLAKPTENPFGSTFAVYLAVHDLEERGILVKIPAKLELDPVTGQITTTFDDLPQFPVADFTLAFRSGQRAPLINPPTCGPHVIAAQMTSYAQPDNQVDVSNTFQVTSGPNGTPCPSSSAGRPFAPKMNAGTVNPSAGSFSPFVFKLTREDQEQEIAQVDTTLPPGVSAKLAGIPYCPEAAIASISGLEGTGAAQFANPSCPAASQIGTIDTGVGAGTGPNYFKGKVFLAGPYKGAPLSLATVIPALAGPYDLGSVVVRAAVYVDPATAQVHVVSDRFPTILHGVLLRVRDIRLNVTRPGTTLNPTNCDPMAVRGTAFSVAGAVAPLSDPFQVANCAGLGFKPKLSFKLKGGTHRGDYPAFSATLTARPGDANIAKTAVTLPHSEFLAQEHIRTICTRVQFAADACPPESIYGKARAITPLLGQPLEGPVYLRSSSHPLPDLVAKLNGQFEVDLVGRIDSVNQGIRNTFSVVPDAPVSKFTLSMQGGKKGLLVNSRNLCKDSGKAAVRMVAQNGKMSLSRPSLRTSCRKASGRKGAAKPQR